MFARHVPLDVGEVPVTFDTDARVYAILEARDLGLRRRMALRLPRIRLAPLREIAFRGIELALELLGFRLAREILSMPIRAPELAMILVAAVLIARRKPKSQAAPTAFNS